MQIELRFGSSTMMLADEFAEMGVSGPPATGATAVVFHFSTSNAKAVWDRAVAEGAHVVQPLLEQFWGELYGQIQDPFGHRWGIGQRTREVSREEIERIAAGLFQ